MMHHSSQNNQQYRFYRTHYKEFFNLIKKEQEQNLQKVIICAAGYKMIKNQ